MNCKEIVRRLEQLRRCERSKVLCGPSGDRAWHRDNIDALNAAMAILQEREE